MHRSGVVLFQGIRAGVIEELPEGGYRFTYDDDYSGPSVSLTLPKKNKVHESRILFPFFDGLIPEGWLLSVTVKNWKVDERDRMGLLLTACSDTIGTVTIQNENKPVKKTDSPEIKRSGSPPDSWLVCPVCMKDLSDSKGFYHPECSKILFGSPDSPKVWFSKNDIEELGRLSVLSRVTIPGVQKKLSVSLVSKEGKESRITITNVWGTHILKPPSEDYPEVPENEHLTMQLAAHSGILTETFGLIPLADGASAFIARRFDRRLEKAERIGLPCEDFAQLTGRLTIEKYKGSLEQAAKSITRWSTVPGDDLLRFFELNLFSFLTGNSDMHLKNFSLLTEYDDADRPVIRLSPAYDLLNTAILLNDDEETALTLNARKRKITYKDFMEFSKTIGIPAKAASRSVDRILAHTESWEHLTGRSFLSGEMQDKYISAVRKRISLLKKRDA